MVPPGLRETLFKLKVKEPVPLALEKEKVWEGFEKTMSTPPVELLTTLPNTLSTKLVVPPPLMPVGKVKTTVKVSVALYVPGLLDSVNDPKLLNPAKPPEVLPPKLPLVKVMPLGGAEEDVVPVTVISLAEALCGASARTAANNIETKNARFKGPSPCVQTGVYRPVSSYYNGQDKGQVCHHKRIKVKSFILCNLLIAHF